MWNKMSLLFLGFFELFFLPCFFYYILAELLQHLLFFSLATLHLLSKLLIYIR